MRISIVCACSNVTVVVQLFVLVLNALFLIFTLTGSNVHCTFALFNLFVTGAAKLVMMCAQKMPINLSFILRMNFPFTIQEK